MEDLRYPIGPFEAVENPSPEQRSLWVEDILDIPAALRLEVQHLTPVQLETPYRPGGWTVRQVVHHMADNDMNAFIRFKKALTEDKPLAGTYRESAWAELGDYADPVEASLVLVEALHSRYAALLRTLHPSDFQRTFTSPAYGEMSLDTALQRFVWHGRHHTAHIVSLKQRMGW